jgi:hypothetical protein
MVKIREIILNDFPFFFDIIILLIILLILINFLFLRFYFLKEDFLIILFILFNIIKNINNKINLK